MRLGSAVSALALSLLISCGDEQAAPPTPPPVEITAVTVTPRDVPALYEFVGITESSRKVEIHARVEGFLDRRVYEEGSLVKDGQTLFVIDRKPFAARVAAARGALAEQQARLTTAEADLRRVRPLAAQNAVSQKDLDEALGKAQAARAAVDVAQADLEQATIDLGYTTIASPVTGLSSFAKVTDGTYVSRDNSLLTYVSALAPMRVNFSVSENQLLEFRASIAQGRLRAPADEHFEVEIVLADGSSFTERGRIAFRDAAFSEQTGTFLVRAEFPNREHVLRPGQFMTVRLHGAVWTGATPVPKRAVMQGAQGAFVWVVDAQGRAELRPVELGAWVGDEWIVKQGLKGGETVAVEGAMKLRADAPVKVREATATDAARAH